MEEQKKVIKFYDTNELLHNMDMIEGDIYLSSITFQELEHIKTSRNKDEDVRFEARKVTRFLRDNEDKYKCITVTKEHYSILEDFNLPMDNDNLIIACAYLLQLETDNDVEFYTDDLCCYNIAKNIFGLSCKSLLKDSKVEKYTGYKEVKVNTDEYNNIFDSYLDKGENKLNLLNNHFINTNE